ncbi:hypothetical protein AB1L12_26305 [Peribacillus frigoritolerans]|uniref:hypothetical protein n=1 Tax=Peribacillus frigoritolerans TaxID=450367 RepID=UPI0039A39885
MKQPLQAELKLRHTKNHLVKTIRGGSENGAIIGEGEVIKVNVKWDGSEESFQLHNKAK